MHPALAAGIGLLVAWLSATRRIGNTSKANHAAHSEGIQTGVPNNDADAIEQEADTVEGLPPGTNTYQTENVIASDIPGDQPIIGSHALSMTDGDDNVYREPGPATLDSLAALTGVTPVQPTDLSYKPADDPYIE